MQGARQPRFVLEILFHLPAGKMGAILIQARERNRCSGAKESYDEHSA